MISALAATSAAEAQARLEKCGYNELPEKKEHPLIKFLSYFWGPIPGMIEIAALLSALVRHWEEFVIILALLVGVIAGCSSTATTTSAPATSAAPKVTTAPPAATTAVPGSDAAITAKLKRRHPHVFGNVQADTAQEVLFNWEQIKKTERVSATGHASLLDGVPRELPALLRAQQGRAAGHTEETSSRYDHGYLPVGSLL